VSLFRVALFAPVLLAGCGRLLMKPPPEGDDPTRLVAQADELARNGSSTEARAVYRQVLRHHSQTPAAADALWGLGQLYVDPDGKLRDYGSARAAFGRLLSEHPDSPHVAAARAWYAALSELMRTQEDANRMKNDIERLKQLDMEQERHR
jgi:TolA-binding protein